MVIENREKKNSNAVFFQFAYMITQSHENKQSGYMDRFHRIFGISNNSGMVVY